MNRRLETLFLCLSPPANCITWNVPEVLGRKCVLLSAIFCKIWTWKIHKKFFVLQIMIEMRECMQPRNGGTKANIRPRHTCWIRTYVVEILVCYWLDGIMRPRDKYSETVLVMGCIFQLRGKSFSPPPSSFIRHPLPPLYHHPLLHFSQLSPLASQIPTFTPHLTPFIESTLSFFKNWRPYVPTCHSFHPALHF